MTVKNQSQSQPLKSHGRSPFWVKSASQPYTPFEEKALAVFQPDVLIPQQFRATYERKFHLDPERTLMLAVLEDAIICFQENVAATCRKKQTLFLDAEEWFRAEDQSYLYAFENVCELLGFDANYLRQGLMRWKEAALEKRGERASRRRLAS